MSTTNDGGISLRDHFAGQAMAAIIGTFTEVNPVKEAHRIGFKEAETDLGGFNDDMGLDGNGSLVAGWAYRFADAMMEARKARKNAEELSEPISVLDLDTRSINVLERLECKTVGDVTRLTAWQLVNMRGAGKTTRRQIVRGLAARGLSLAEGKTEAAQ